MKTTMKKLSVFLVVSSLGLTAFSKTRISNFNEIIEENNKAQFEMHDQVRKSLDETDQVMAELRKQRIETVAEESEAINVPTDKKHLTFAKEQERSRPSKKENDKRLAQELDDIQ